MSVPLVLDSSAVLAFLLGQPGEGKVRELLKSARGADTAHALSVVNWGEVVYSLHRFSDEKGVQLALLRLDSLPIDVIPADRELAFAAAALKTGRGLGYADCYAAALAQRRKTAVVTGDPDFKRVEDLVKVVWLS